ncbi:uncharacterized protein PgNI_02013 [Pyricularia grisea]|uniref:Uncharacterized protein n=1 Tax=Pyricularia grisea TaxID=148305 RepID=A0A6P8BLT2_PYRGI|nr:uncharacterized protein PgNI_02013 [Pyricularia grisea]TLD17836.1 hypothetical protein PgNI_02013 [Pyricularia grisea]
MHALLPSRYILNATNMVGWVIYRIGPGAAIPARRCTPKGHSARISHHSIMRRNGGTN